MDSITSMPVMVQFILAGIISVAVGYLLGSVSFSIIITKLFTKSDIRDYGSGNAGATNVMRSVGVLPSLLTFIFDFLKCVISVLIGYYICIKLCDANGVSASMAQIGKYAAGIGCMMGHIFPLYFGFKGGKGVVTTAALICLIDWRVFIPAIATFIIVFAIKKIISLSSIIGVSLYPVYTFIILFLFDYTGSPLVSTGTVTIQYVILSTIAAAVIGGIVVIVHRPNIERLRKGEEKPLTIGGKKSK